MLHWPLQEIALLLFLSCCFLSFLWTLNESSALIVAASLPSLYRTSGDLDLSSYDRGLNDYLLAGDSGRMAEVDSAPDMLDVTRTSTVKFQDGSDDEESVNGTESEVNYFSPKFSKIFPIFPNLLYFTSSSLK